jgi:site-specific DNA recombinase
MPEADRIWIIYARVSSDEQIKGTSLGGQVEACQQMCRLLGHEVGRVVDDGGQSAGSLNRPGMQEILADLRDGQVAGIVVHKLDRLTRSLRDLLDLVDLASQHNCALVSVSEQLDTSSPMGRFFVQMLGAIAEWERATIRERVTAGIRRRQAEGGYIGGRVPVGLQVIEEGGVRQLAACPQTGPGVADLWQLAAEGASMRGLARLMRVRFPARSWAAGSLQRILTSDVYIGLLVDAETAGRARAAMAGRQHDRLQPGRAGRSEVRCWPLAGIARCASCGAPLRGMQCRGRGGEYGYYRCSSKSRGSGCQAPDLPALQSEAVAIESLQLALDEQGDARALIMQRRAEIAALAASADDRLAGARLERDGLQVQQDRLLDMVQSGGLAAAAAVRRIESLGSEIAVLDSQMAQMEAQRSVVGMEQQDLEAALDQMRRGVTGLAESSLEDQRAALAGLVRSIAIGRDADHVEIDLCLPKQANPRLARVCELSQTLQGSGQCANPWRVRVGVRWGRGRDGRWVARAG